MSGREAAAVSGVRDSRASAAHRPSWATEYLDGRAHRERRTLGPHGDALFDLVPPALGPSAGFSQLRGPREVAGKAGGSCRS